RALWSAAARCGVDSTSWATAGSGRATPTPDGRVISGRKNRRLRRGVRPGDVVLFTDWTLVGLFPPLRSRWACVGKQAVVPITGATAKRVLFGTINLWTAHRVVTGARHAGGTAARAFLAGLRRRHRGAGTIWLLADRASGHTAQATLALAARLRIHLLWLPKQAPALNAMDQLWRELKRQGDEVA